MERCPIHGRLYDEWEGCRDCKDAQNESLRNQERIAWAAEEAARAAWSSPGLGVCSACGQQFVESTRCTKPPATKWIGSLARYANVGCCPRCYNEALRHGEQQDFDRDDWLAHFSSRLNRLNGVDAARKLYAETRDSFPEIAILALTWIHTTFEDKASKLSSIEDAVDLHRKLRGQFPDTDRRICEWLQHKCDAYFPTLCDAQRLREIRARLSDFPDFANAATARLKATFEDRLKVTGATASADALIDDLADEFPEIRKQALDCYRDHFQTALNAANDPDDADNVATFAAKYFPDIATSAHLKALQLRADEAAAVARAKAEADAEAKREKVRQQELRAIAAKQLADENTRASNRILIIAVSTLALGIAIFGILIFWMNHRH